MEADLTWAFQTTGFLFIILLKLFLDHNSVQSSVFNNIKTWSHNTYHLSNHNVDRSYESTQISLFLLNLAQEIHCNFETATCFFPLAFGKRRQVFDLPSWALCWHFKSIHVLTIIINNNNSLSSRTKKMPSNFRSAISDKVLPCKHEIIREGSRICWCLRKKKQMMHKWQKFTADLWYFKIW